MNPKESIQITNKEWYVMKALWEKEPQSLMDLVGELKESIGWSKSTCATMVRRMTEKELISYKLQGKTKLFYTLIKKEEVIVPETKNFLKRIFDGSVGMMMSTLMEQGSLSDNDIEELEKILYQAKKK